jgi:hypothetical protein
VLGISTIRVQQRVFSNRDARRASVRNRHTRFRELIVIGTCVMFTIGHTTARDCASQQVQQWDRMCALLGNDKFSVKKISELRQQCSLVALTSFCHREHNF